MTVFDDGIALERSGDGALRGRTIPQWANMVGPFGGITAATMLRAVELQDEVRGLPVALTVNYLAPIADGEFEIRARAVRTNRSNQHWYVEMNQGAAATTTATAVFGARRATWDDTELKPPSVAAPDAIGPGANPMGVVWLDNYDIRFVEGAIPHADPVPDESSQTVLWVRDNPARGIDFASLAAVCDIFYPRVYLRRGRPMPAGTISFTVYFHADEAELAEQGEDFALGVARAQRFRNGHFDQTAQIWGRSGALLATTHQIVYYKG
ncbi:thioesterase family protein [Mycolicibacterium cosmeticum]|uniref:acyl-CoA thioesterase n=1 Tax=Mycolicibacterium cosmeticum TaxID=258533 RepID=UPI003204D0B0